MSEQSKSNITKAIIEVMKSVKGMEKNSTIGKGQQQYNGTKDQDVKEVFNKALSENGLCMLPIKVEESTDITKWTVEDKYGTKQKQSVFTKVKVTYLLLHTSDESIELVGYGHGVDPQDKGAGKATTYALKNCLLYTFLTPVGKIDDTDETHSSDIETPTTPTTPTDKPWLSLGTDQYNKAIDKLQRGEKTLDDLLNHYSIRPEVLETIKNAIK